MLSIKLHPFRKRKSFDIDFLFTQHYAENCTSPTVTATEQNDVLHSEGFVAHSTHSRVFAVCEKAVS